MIPSKQFLKDALYKAVENKNIQGYETKGLSDKLDGIANTYDAILEFGASLKELQYRSDWVYVEPTQYDEIEAEMADDRFDCLTKSVDVDACMKKAEAAFLGSVMGCILGKPLEVNPSLLELKTAGEKVGEWPIDDYISQKFLDALGREHESTFETLKDNITYVASDDDINYTVLGMINLENHGAELDIKGVCDTWANHAVRGYTFGPERVANLCVSVDHLEGATTLPANGENYSMWTDAFSWNDAHCGAQIRADAYGYAFPGRPDLAAKYACVDASLSHTKTGVYSTMFTAAAIAGMFTVSDPMDAFTNALKFIPQKSRYAKMVKICIDYVNESTSFMDAYEKINHRFSEYTHCGVYQETGTLINALKYAENVWNGVCLQVMQGNDTDSYGCTAGSMLGAYFGYEKLDMDRLTIFNDTIHIPLANFHEQSLTKLAKRMGSLVEKFADII